MARNSPYSQVTMLDPRNVLSSGPIYRFADWPNLEVPRVAIGCCTIWEGETLVYVGIAGRALDREQVSRLREKNSNPKGLYDRLNSHAPGRRSGDQFCVYVADRLVLPELSETEIKGIAAGGVSFDGLVRRFIRDHLAYRFCELDSYAEACKIEREIQSGALPCGPPLLNPISSSSGDGSEG